MNLMNIDTNITMYIERISRYYDENNVPYVIVGGLAVNAIGRSRMTIKLHQTITGSTYNIEPAIVQYVASSRDQI